MKQLIFIVIFFQLAVLLAGQDDRLDSLVRATKSMKDDTAKVMQLLSLSRTFSRVDLNQSRQFCDQAEDLSRKLGFWKGVAGTWFERSIISMRTGNIDSAIHLNERSATINDSLGIQDQLGHNYNLMGTLYLMQNETYKALEAFTASLSLFKACSDSTGITYVYNSLGNLHEAQGNYDSAAGYFFRYVEINMAAGRDDMAGIGLVNLSNVYLKLEDYRNARDYALQSIQANQQANRPDLLLMAYKNLGIASAKEKLYDESTRYFNLATDLATQLGSEAEIASICINRGNMYEERMLFDQAMLNYKKALAIGHQLENKGIITLSLVNIGLIHFRRGEYGRAIVIYDSCLQMLEGTGNYYQLSTIYYNLYTIYEARDDARNALRYLASYHDMKDSTVNLESKKAIADLTFRYERERDQAKIIAYEYESLQKDIILDRRTRQRNGYMFAGGGILVVFVFISILLYQRNKRTQLIADQKIRQIEEEKKLLSARFLVEGQEEERKRIARELHDGLGVILSTAKLHFTTIRDKSPEAVPLIQKATELLEQASGDVRRISHNMMPGLLTRYGFFEAVEDLFEQVDEMEGVRAEVSLEGEKRRLKENTEIMLYRIIQEMVNNTLKHAGAGHIRLTMKLEETVLIVGYRDDGAGFDFDEKMKSKSMGLTGIQSRVKYLGGDLEVDTGPGRGVSYAFNIKL